MRGGIKPSIDLRSANNRKQIRFEYSRGKKIEYKEIGHADNMWADATGSIRKYDFVWNTYMYRIAQ